MHTFNPSSTQSEVPASESILPRLHVIGNAALLDLSLVGLLCSTRLTGTAILRLYDLAHTLRDAEIPVIGGFHTPMERECLRILLRGRQPVVVCPARSLERMRLPVDWQTAIGEERLLIVSALHEGNRRVTVGLAERRNRLVLALARALIVGSAGPGSRSERLSVEALDAGKRVYTLDLPENEKLRALGAPMYGVKELISRLGSQ